MHSDKNDVKYQLQEKGYKLTTQRRAILDTIMENSDKHLSSEDIYDLVRKKCPEIGLATVYRSLQIFEELGLIYKLDFNDGRIRYDVYNGTSDHQHHHLICISCGAVIEVEEDLLDDMERHIMEAKDFEIVDHNVKFFGYCSKCRSKNHPVA
ncbi:MAG: Fur family transcriptional regulator [Thermoanaerobacteraceae bacterium]|nr:Fur family transcriptional regulator [Thermoanaerobacteraceae bacterium]